MTCRGKPKAGGRKRKQNAPISTAQKHQRIQTGQSTTKGSTERIQLSVNDGAEISTQGTAAGQGNVSWPPLVENVFDISTILKESSHTNQSSATNDTMQFGLHFGDGMPPDLMKCSDDDLSAHVPHQLKEKNLGT